MLAHATRRGFAARSLALPARACACRALSSAPRGGDGDGGGGRRQSPQEIAADLGREEEDLMEQMLRRMSFQKPPRLRGLPPAPQNFHVESWAPPSYVSADIDENVLRFRTRYYLEAIPEDLDDPTPADKKVVLQVTVSQLGLSKPETRRLKAVAGSRYHPKNDELVLVSRKYREPHRNKADLRKTLGLLVDDAKANPIEKGGKGPHGNFFKVRQLAGRQKRKSAF
jgi:hypothetical protein